MGDFTTQGGTGAYGASEGRALLDKSLTEKQFQDQIVHLAKLSGWRCYHTWDSRRSDPGFPDLSCVRGRWLVFFEVKRATGRASGEQLAWIAALGAVPYVRALVVRPADWGEIERILTGRETAGT